MTVEWECVDCGHLHEGKNPPRHCPDCGAVDTWAEVEYVDDDGDDDSEDDEDSDED